MASSLRSTVTRRTTLNAPGQIEMVDNSRPAAEREDSYAAQTASDTDDAGEPADQNALSHTTSRLNRQSLRRELAQRKYNKYSEARYADEPETELRHVGSSNGVARTETAGSVSSIDSLKRMATQRTAVQDQAGRLRRGGRKVKGLIKRRKRRLAPEGDVEIDVLVENQRGAYFFGRPLFSSQSLLNFDPPAWLNGQGQPSSVNITNAQVPDPSWEWAWSCWYVDMSHDVDEQGWQYSFMFQNRFPWHGTHPWFHSYVRRRHWVRKRVRKHAAGFDGRSRDVRNAKDAHKLNSDYFTIHPANRRDLDAASTGVSGTLRSGSVDLLSKHHEADEDEASDDIDTLGALLRRLRLAEVDRDKVKLVLRFMDEGGQDVYYLADEMPHIMSLLVFQYSQRRLLSEMMAKMTEAEQRSDESGAADSDDRPEPDSEQQQKTKNWLRAVEAADAQIQQLEFWSDIRDAVNKGESRGAVDDAESGWRKGWDGLDSSGSGRATMNEASPVDHGTVAEAEARAKAARTRAKGKGRADQG